MHGKWIIGCCNAPPVVIPDKATALWELEDPSDGRKLYFLSQSGAGAGKKAALSQRAQWFCSMLREMNDFRIEENGIVGLRWGAPSTIYGADIGAEVGNSVHVSAHAPEHALPGLLAWMKTGCPEAEAEEWTKVCYPYSEHVITELCVYP